MELAPDSRSLFSLVVLSAICVWCVQGGLTGLINKCNSNLGVIEAFVKEHDWIDFLAKDPATRSNTSVCLSLKLSKEQIKKMTTLLEKEGVAYDIGSYRCGLVAAGRASRTRPSVPWRVTLLD